MGRHERAAHHYQRALTLASGQDADRKAEAEIHHRIGRFRIVAGDAPRALEALRAAEALLRGAPDAANAGGLAPLLTDLAEVLLRLGLTEEAKALMQRASETDDPASLQRLAELAHRFNHRQEAVAVLRRVVRLYPDSGETHHALADMLARSWRCRCDDLREMPGHRLDERPGGLVEGPGRADGRRTV